MRPLLVSCKLGPSIPPAERRDIIEASVVAGARPVMATRTKRGYVDIHLVRIDTSYPQIDVIPVPRRPGKEVEENDA
jgi:hypothetical protein